MTKSKKSDAEALPEIRRRPMVLPINCGMCLFYKRMATYLRPCQEMGTPASAETCARFAPDPAQLGDDPGRALRALATASRPTLLAATLLASKKLKRTGFSLGDRVFIHVCGGDYLSNYATGVVAGATSDKMIIAGREGYSALLSQDAVLDEDAWRDVRKRMVAADRVNDPQGGLRKIAVRSKPRLVAFVPEELARVRAKSRPRRKPGRPAKRGSNVININ